MSIITTRVTNFEIQQDVVAPVDFSNQASAATINSAANDWRPLGSLVAERDYTIDITAGQDLAADSLWHLIYTSAGQEVTVTLKPYGNSDAPSEAQPWVRVTAIVAEPDGALVGGAQAADTTTRRTLSVTWQCTRPVLVTSGT